MTLESQHAAVLLRHHNHLPLPSLPLLFLFFLLLLSAVSPASPTPNLGRLSHTEGMILDNHHVCALRRGGPGAKRNKKKKNQERGLKSEASRASSNCKSPLAGRCDQICHKHAVHTFYIHYRCTSTAVQRAAASYPDVFRSTSTKARPQRAPSSTHAIIKKKDERKKR